MVWRRSSMLTIFRIKISTQQINARFFCMSVCVETALLFVPTLKHCIWLTVCIRLFVRRIQSAFIGPDPSAGSCNINWKWLFYGYVHVYHTIANQTFLERVYRCWSDLKHSPEMRSNIILSVKKCPNINYLHSPRLKSYYKILPYQLGKVKVWDFSVKMEHSRLKSCLNKCFHALFWWVNNLPMCIVSE